MTSKHLLLIDASGIQWPQPDIYALYSIDFPNGKKYIGLTNNPVRRAKGHSDSVRFGRSFRLYNAIRKHGVGNVVMRVIAVGHHDYIHALEVAAISQYSTKNIAHGYNVLDGGAVNPMTSPLVREKLRASLTGRQDSEEVKKRKRESWTPQRRDAMSAVHKGKKISQAHRDKINAALAAKSERTRLSRFKVTKEEHSYRCKVGSKRRWERDLPNRLEKNVAREIWLDRSNDTATALALMPGWSSQTANRNFGPRGITAQRLSPLQKAIIIRLSVLDSGAQIARDLGLHELRVQRLIKGARA